MNRICVACVDFISRNRACLNVVRLQLVRADGVHNQVSVPVKSRCPSRVAAVPVSCVRKAARLECINNRAIVKGLFVVVVVHYAAI